MNRTFFTLIPSQAAIAQSLVILQATVFPQESGFPSNCRKILALLSNFNFFKAQVKKELLTRTVLVNKNLLTVIFPVNNKLLTSTVPVNKKLLTGNVLVNNCFLI